VKAVINSALDLIMNSRKAQGLALLLVGVMMFAGTGVADGISNDIVREGIHVVIISFGLLAAAVIFTAGARGRNLQ
jgi:hypothetical protein